jgi:hypothetical protein
MLVIDRVSWSKPRYTVHDDAGNNGHLIRQRFGESATGEIDGEPFEMRRAGRRRFSFARSGTVLATDEAGKRGRWTILAADGSEYQLQRGSRWRSNMELYRSGARVGAIRKGRAPDQVGTPYAPGRPA